MSAAIEVDVVVLTRDARPIRPDVLEAIQSQAGVHVQLHRVIGNSRPSDPNRWATIARARNVARDMGDSPWLMYVDDDVVLGDNAIAQLVEDIEAQPAYVAMAADYLGERNPNGISPHVAMGATLFRRDSLRDVEFRWEKDKCECSCMTEDLRKRFRGIEYSERATATHLELDTSDSHAENDSRHGSAAEVEAKLETTTADDRTTRGEQSVPVDQSVLVNMEVSHRREGEILVSFDRGHQHLFIRQFLQRLRHSGNWHKVHAVTFGMRRKHLRDLTGLEGVELHAFPFVTKNIPRARLTGFQLPLSKMCPKTPVAYWDAGDVLFQASLEPLWESIRTLPDKLQVVEEPWPFEKNGAQRHWINMIEDEVTRRNAHDLSTGKSVVNGGFIAGRAGQLLDYFRKAAALAVGEMKGVGGGDQVILNYCYRSDPNAFHIADNTWNYCLFGRSSAECKVSEQNHQFIDLVNDRVVAVVHGNGGSLLA